MTIQQIYKLAIEMGINADLRGKKAVEKYLERQDKIFEQLSPKKKLLFDRDRLTNPYMDSGIWVDNKKPVKKVLAGIDIDTGEVLLSERLGCDTIITHHPIGKGLAALADVMHLQADVLALYGVPINVAEHLMKIRISEIDRAVHPSNHYQSIDAAKLLGINLMNVHTSADNMVASYIQKEISKKELEYVGEVMEVLSNIEEYKQSAKLGVPIKLFVGDEDDKAGKIALTELTGGTEGTKDIYRNLQMAGVGTIIGMHMTEKNREEAKKYHINVIICGDVPSDSIGMNLFLDELEKKDIKVIPAGGLIRVKR